MKTLLHIVSSALLALLTTISSPAFAQLGSLSSDLVFTPITPCRIMDTRNPGIKSGMLLAGTTRAFNGRAASFAHQGGNSVNCNTLNTTDQAAIVLNVTVVSTGSPGYITAFPADATQPVTSTLNFGASGVTGNNATLKLSQAGTGDEFKIYSTSNVDVIADIVGYYAKPVATAMDCINVLSAGVDLPPAGLGQAIYSPQCSAGYTVMSGGCFRTSGTSGGYHNTYAFGPTSSSNLTNPSAFYCGMQNTHPTDTSNVTALARCCRIPGR